MFEESPLPMVILDGRRRYVDANGPARLVFRVGLDELRERVVDELTPECVSERLEEMWERFLVVDHVSGTYETETPDGTRLNIVYYAVANALPGLHVGLFAPASWGEDELNTGARAESEPVASLTLRELDVLRLAARGLSGPQIARELVLSTETVKNHFAKARAKLGVPNRAAAVARAIQLGLID